MNPKAENSSAERRAPISERRAPRKIEQAACPEKYGGGGRELLKEKSITYSACICQDFVQRALSTKIGAKQKDTQILHLLLQNQRGTPFPQNGQTERCVLRPDSPSSRPKHTAPPERPMSKEGCPNSSAQSRLPHSSAERRAPSAGRQAPSAHFFRASRLPRVSLQLGLYME